MASLAEQQLLLESLLTLTAPTLNFFVMSLVGSLALGAAMTFDDPAVLVLALILLPFFRPIYGLALLPAAWKISHVLKSLISLLVLVLFVLAAGLLSGWLSKEFPPQNINLYRFSAPYWLDLALVSASAILGTWMMIRTGELPRLVGVLLSYEILLPLAIAGFSFPLGASAIFPGALMVSLAHLGLAFLLAGSTFLLLGLPSRRRAGWLLLFIPLLLALGSLLLNLPNFTGAILARATPSPTPSVTLRPSNTPLPDPSPTLTPRVQQSPTAAATLTPTRSATPLPSETHTPTLTQTPEPTTFWAVLIAEQGAVLRESPTFEAPIAGYLNNGDAVEILEAIIAEGGSLWYRVSTPNGQNGWLLGSLVNTQTPTPPSE